MSDSGTFDYIIIGAGSGGCVLANRLSGDAKTKVLLIEAGGSDNRFWLVPRWTKISPCFIKVSPSSMMAVISPSMTMA